MGKKMGAEKRGRGKQKSFLMTGVVVGIILILFLAGAGAIYYFSQRLPNLKEKAETIVVLKEMGTPTDLPNPDEGTVRIDFRAVDSDVNVGETPPTKILLFRSKVLGGLNVYYLYEGRNVTAGMPKLTSPSINLLDGTMHTVIYTFKRGYKQMLIVDGQVMGESDFLPAIKQAPTGFLVYSPDKEIQADNIGVSVSSYDKMVEPGQVTVGKLE